MVDHLRNYRDSDLERIAPYFAARLTIRPEVLTGSFGQAHPHDS